MATKIIKMNRGDSFNTAVVIPDKENPAKNYFLTAKDVLYFALCCPNQPFEEAIILKGYTHEDQDQKTGEIIIKLPPSETRHLVPGVYYYTTKLQRGGTIEAIVDCDEPEEVRTIIERTKFIVNE
jgi:hypothetical protein